MKSSGFNTEFMLSYVFIALTFKYANVSDGREFGITWFIPTIFLEQGKETKAQRGWGSK